MIIRGFRTVSVSGSGARDIFLRIASPSGESALKASLIGSAVLKR
jgi:hypothetical protein